MKIQAETMKRIFADMTAMWNAVPKAKQDEMREALASGNITITNLGWQLYHLAFADRNYDDSHPRYQTRARILPLAPFPMYPDGANDDHMATMFKRFELPPVSADTPPRGSEYFRVDGMKDHIYEPITIDGKRMMQSACVQCGELAGHIVHIPEPSGSEIPPAEKKYITVDGETVEDICEQCEKNLFDCECADTPPADDSSQDEEEEETRERITCDQCELLAINGVCCHEIGCPNMGARWDAENREWIKQRKCFECGCTIDRDDPCCSAPFEDDDFTDVSDDDEDAGPCDDYDGPARLDATCATCGYMHSDHPEVQ